MVDGSETLAYYEYKKSRLNKSSMKMNLLRRTCCTRKIYWGRIEVVQNVGGVEKSLIK